MQLKSHTCREIKKMEKLILMQSMVGWVGEELGTVSGKGACEEDLEVWVGLTCRTDGREATPAAPPQVAHC